MANPEHVERLLAGVEGWNQWRVGNREVRPDLSEAHLSGTNLRHAVLSRADLNQADLRDAKLSGTDLRDASIIEAHLSGADLRYAALTQAMLIHAQLSWTDFWRADLQEAILFGANLRRSHLQEAVLKRADLQEADLQEADLQEAVLQETTLTKAIFSTTIVTGVDLRGVQGLDTIEHHGPSSIGIDTLYKSGGNISESFLRGCGVPNSMIEYARSLVTAARPIDYYSCFISYANEDRTLAERLYADLQAKGVRCWYAPHDLEIGESILSGIDRGIRLYDKVLLILSAASVQSAWIEQEVQMALARERTERRRVLFPIRIDDSVSAQTAGWPALVWSQRHVGDFCAWKTHDAYHAAFQRVLRDLTANADAPPA